MQRLYLYLANRNKDGIKLVTVLQGTETMNADLTNLEKLNLPQVWEKQISRIIHDHRMLYHPRIESAKSFRELRSRLENRGFKNIPSGANPLLNLKAYSRAPIADTSSCKVKRTMIRKNKS